MAARQVIPESVESLLLRVKSTTSQRADELFRTLPGRGGFVPRLRQWLEENRSAFPEPFRVDELDSMFDLGIDVLLDGARQNARVGFQVKSDRDLQEEAFTPRLKSQILDAHKRGVELLVLVFACTTKRENLDRIRYWQNYALDHPHPKILCLAPERAAGLYELFEQPVEPITLEERTWSAFFREIGKPNLVSFYLDTWPGLTPDQRFLPPEIFGSLRRSVQENRLTILIGPPAVGKTFASMQLLWEAFRAGRPIHWITSTDIEVTEGLIPKAEMNPLERLELKRRVDGLLRTLGSEPGVPPRDELDIVSKILVPDALVYIEDPFGKSEGEYEVSLASYDFFDIQRFVEILEHSSARAGCRIIITSREPLFQRWLADLGSKGKEAPQSSVIRLGHSDYYLGPLFDHAVLLAQARGLAEPEAIAEVLVEHVDSPLDIDTLIRLLPPHAKPADAEAVVVGWTGDYREKIGGRIAPRDDRDLLLLLLVAASDFRYDSLHDPLDMYTKLHSDLGFEGEPQAAFQGSLKRLSPFLAARDDFGLEPQLFVPSHSVIKEAIQEQVSTPKYRALLRKIAHRLPEIPPIAVQSRSAAGAFDLAQLIDPWSDHFLIALYLFSLGLALEGEELAESFERLLFEQVRLHGSKYRRVMEIWHLLPERLRRRILAKLEQTPQEDPFGLRDAAASLPRTKLAPSDAWRVLELLLEEPNRGSGETIYLESPWAYLFLHLEEMPQCLKEKLDAWASEDPGFFVYIMDKGLLLNWDRLSERWRSCLSHPACIQRRSVREQIVRTTARLWSKAPQVYRELFDFLAGSPDRSVRAFVGAEALSYAEEHPDLEEYALRASQDPDPTVRMETFRAGRGGEAHRRVAEALLAVATSGSAADMMLDLLEEDVREEIAPWERELLARCERLAGDASQAAIAYASFAGKARVKELGYEPAGSPFEEPDIVRAAWIWSHLNSLRARPVLSDDDLERLLKGIQDRRVRDVCLYYTSYQLTALPDRFASLLTELSESSEADADVIHRGASRRQPVSRRRTLRFAIRSMVD